MCDLARSSGKRIAEAEKKLGSSSSDAGDLHGMGGDLKAFSFELDKPNNVYRAVINNRHSAKQEGPIPAQ
jgi:hypothetical protein